MKRVDYSLGFGKLLLIAFGCRFSKAALVPLGSWCWTRFPAIWGLCKAGLTFHSMRSGFEHFVKEWFGLPSDFLFLPNDNDFWSLSKVMIKVAMKSCLMHFPTFYAKNKMVVRFPPHPATGDGQMYRIEPSRKNQPMIPVSFFSCHCLPFLFTVRDEGDQKHDVSEIQELFLTNVQILVSKQVISTIWASRFSFCSRLGPLIFGIPGGANGKGGMRWQQDEHGWR